MESVLSARTLFEQSAQSSTDVQSKQEQGVAKHERNLNLALQHALQIQHRKDVEAQILASIEVLADIPQTSDATAAEIAAFVRSVAIFQPNDYDDLIAERVSQLRCGYVLCDQKPRSCSTSTWSLAEGAADFCSRACQVKTAYVRAQLDPVPAWERSPLQQVQIVLKEGLSDQRKVDPLTELAFERGEKVSSQKPAQVMSEEVVEKSTNSGDKETLPPQHSSTNSVEGYVPRHEQQEEATMLVDQHTPEERTAQVDGPDDEEQQWKDMFAHLQSAQR